MGGCEWVCMLGNIACLSASSDEPMGSLGSGLTCQLVKL